jgi:hypothetical protein
MMNDIIDNDKKNGKFIIIEKLNLNVISFKKQEK